MKQFRDCGGRTWQLRATVRTLDDIRDCMGIDLMGDPDELPAGVQAIMSSIDLVASAGCLLAAADPLEFRAGLDASTMERLRDSVMEELLDFFGHWRPTAVAVIRQAWSIASRMENASEEGIEQLARSFTEWRGSLGLTPEDSPSDN